MNFIKAHLVSSIFLLSAIASLISIFFPLFQNTIVSHIALCCLVLSLLFLLYKIVKAIERFTEMSYPNEYATHSSFIKYSTKDGIHINYEVYKSVQCKRLYKTSYEYDFKWSGKHQAQLSSKLQRYNKTVKNETGMDKAILEYTEPLYYNQTAIIHLLAELKDPELVSKPYVCVKIDYKIHIQHFRIELFHKQKIKARVERRKINEPFANEFELIDSLHLNENYIEYHLINPEIGYFYRIIWE